MKRFHVHVSVADLPASIRYYTALFNAEPTVVRDDYAKWALDDPRVNFAISNRMEQPGVDHLGIQVETDAELAEMQGRLANADLPIQSQSATNCCYATSNKHWSVDPQGIAWETFHSLGSAPTYGESRDRGAEAAACCVPARLNTAPKQAARSACCTPESGCC
ncbi:Cadmium-induced protein CadI [Cupriavidus laharis]|uniref:Cadmium-induced protein CadI n=1 Tax=Cupriavidus laharis TaxID=151654 RepID=A0ABN7Y3S6_9BURK|nr:ArsI/CadI family heavy metal resistance metalloenzyme [Cupriavidus laharis]CAG9167938.1 Cadmium-induced protein CadI [Cupriavidus laharis]